MFELAAGLKKTLARRGGEKTLCLCTANKAVNAACVLASLAGSCQLILPYSFSAHALTEMYDAVGFDFAIADHRRNAGGRGNNHAISRSHGKY